MEIETIIVPPEEDDILIPDDGAEVALAEPEKAPKAEPEPAKSADDGIEELRRQLEAEKAARLQSEERRVQTEQRAREREEEASRYRGQAERSRADNLANAVDLAAQEIDKQKAAYKAAMEAGDYGQAAEAQAEISKAAAAELMANQARAAYEAQMRAREAQPKPQVATYTPATQQWIDKHPEFLSDQGFKRRAFAAHGMAEAEGFAPDTTAYFDRIESLMGLKMEEQKPAPKATPAPAAPVSRGVTTGADGRKSYHLTVQEKEIADFSGVSYLEYAKNREKIRAEEGR